MKYVSVGIVFVSLFAWNVAKAVSNASLEWDQNADSSIAGYNVYYGGASRSYTNMINAGDAANVAVGGLIEGKTYYFAVTAYTFDGLESDFSGEFVYVVPGLLTMTKGLTASGLIQIHFPVASGHMYELQQSVDLISWTTIWQTAGISNIWVEFDVTANTSEARYYRVVQH